MCTSENHHNEQPNMLIAALWYANRGYYVFPIHEPIFDEVGHVVGCTCEEYKREHPDRYAPNPDTSVYTCENPGKCPRVKWSEWSTTDPQKIRGFWYHHPNSNIGIDCGKSQILAWDADSYKSDYVDADFMSDADRETIIANSGGGGEQYWYAMPEGKSYSNRANGMPEGNDIRGKGGYIVAPPSLHKTGNRYEFASLYDPTDIELAPMPQALQDILDNAGGHSNGTSMISGPSDIEAVDRGIDVVEALIEHADLEHTGAQDYDGGRKWIIEDCPYNPDHDRHGRDRSAFVIVYRDGRIGAGCHHSRCQKRIEIEGNGNGWQFLKKLVGFTPAPQTPTPTTYTKDEVLEIAQYMVAMHDFDSDSIQRTACAVLQHAGKVDSTFFHASSYSLPEYCGLGHTTVAEALRYLCPPELDKYLERLTYRIDKLAERIHAIKQSDDPYSLLSEDEQASVIARINKASLNCEDFTIEQIVHDFMDDKYKRLNDEEKRIQKRIAAGVPLPLLRKLGESELGFSYEIDTTSDMFKIRTGIINTGVGKLPCTDFEHIEHIRFMMREMAEDYAQRNPSRKGLDRNPTKGKYEQGTDPQTLIQDLLGEHAQLYDLLYEQSYRIGDLAREAGLPVSRTIDTLYTFGPYTGKSGIQPLFHVNIGRFEGRPHMNANITVSLNPHWMTEDDETLCDTANALLRKRDTQDIMNSSAGNQNTTRLTEDGHEEFVQEIQSLGASSLPILSALSRAEGEEMSINEIVEDSGKSRGTVYSFIKKATDALIEKGRGAILEVRKEGRKKLVSLPSDWKQRIEGRN